MYSPSHSSEGMKSPSFSKPMRSGVDDAATAVRVLACGLRSSGRVHVREQGANKTGRGEILGEAREGGVGMGVGMGWYGLGGGGGGGAGHGLAWHGSIYYGGP